MFFGMRNSFLMSKEGYVLRIVWIHNPLEDKNAYIAQKVIAGGMQEKF